MLEVDPAIRLTRFAWLRTPPEAPSEKHLYDLITRLNFVRSFKFDPRRRDQIHPGRWSQLVREGDVTPSWLTGDFSPGRRRSLIAAQLLELNGKLTDAAVTMFCRLVARLFTSSKARQERRHLDARKDTARLLGLFRDTIDALAMAVETGEDAFETLDREVGWHVLVQARRDVAAMAASADPDPLIGAAERYGGVRRCMLALVDTLVFRSARRNDPLLAAVELLRQLRSDIRRPLPSTPPVGWKEKPPGMVRKLPTL